MKSIALVLLALCVPTIANAQTAQDKAIAEQLFDTAKKLFDTGNYADACPKFADSQRLDRGIGTALFEGECWERLGRIASAKDAFNEAFNLAQKQGDKRAAIARARAEALSPTKLAIEVDPRIFGVEVRRDGIPVTPGTDIVDGGRHEIVATAPGYQTFSTTIEAPKERGSLVVKIEFVPLPSEAMAPAPVPPSAITRSRRPPPPPIVRRETSSGISPLAVTGMTMAGVGVAGLVVGTVMGVKALEDWNASNDPTIGACDRNSDACRTVRGVELRNSAQAFGTISTVAFVAGGALVVGGITLFVLAPSKNVRAAIGPQSITVAGTF